MDWIDVKDRLPDEGQRVFAFAWKMRNWLAYEMEGDASKRPCYSVELVGNTVFCVPKEKFAQRFQYWAPVEPPNENMRSEILRRRF